jgi:hypothetical protein
MRLTPAAADAPPACGLFQIRSPAAVITTSAMPAIAGVFHLRAGASRTICTPLVTVVVGADASDSANATSFAVWKRLSRSFSRQWRTMWSSAGDTLRPVVVSSGGSSRRTAAIVSLAVSRLKAFRPDRSSYRIAPKEKMSVRWSTAGRGAARATCSPSCP